MRLATTAGERLPIYGVRFACTQIRRNNAKNVKINRDTIDGQWTLEPKLKYRRLWVGLSSALVCRMPLGWALIILTVWS